MGKQPPRRSAFAAVAVAVDCARVAVDRARVAVTRVRAGRSRHIAVLFGFVAALVAAPSWSETPLGEEEEEVVYAPLRVVVDEAYPPHQFRDRRGRPAGFDVDLLRLVAEQANLEVRFELGAWPEIRAGLEDGSVDLNPGVFRTPTRQAFLAFTAPTAWVHHALFVREDSELTGPEDLRDGSVLINRGGFHEDYLHEHHVPVSPILAADNREALVRLAAGEGDAAVTLNTQGLYWIRTLRLEGVRAIGEPIDTRRLRMAVPLARQDLVHRLNEGLVAVHRSGAYDALFDQWFGVLPPPAVPVARFLQFAGAAIALILVLAVASILWSRTLQQQVDRRTRDLLETDAKLRATFAAAPGVGLVVAEDPSDGARLLDWSEGAERMWGHGREHALGLTVGDLRSSADRTAHETLLGERLGEGGRAREAELLRADGEPLPAFVVASLLPPDAEGHVRLLYVAFDLSDRVQAEREKFALESRLQEARKMEALGRLAGGVAHDFKNVLTTIVGNAVLARRSLDEPKRAEESLDEILQASQAVDRIIDQLLAFSRRQESEPRETDWNQVTRDVEAVLRRLLPQGIEMRVAFASAPWPVRIDPGQASQVVMNLVVNARDAIDGKGHVDVRTENEMRDGQAWSVLIVRDDGRGMDDETRARIFEPFFTTKAEGGGTGLGLATVYGVVEQAGGRIEVDSKSGEGTTFRVALPRSEGGSEDEAS